MDRGECIWSTDQLIYIIFGPDAAFPKEYRKFCSFNTAFSYNLNNERQDPNNNLIEGN